MVTVADLQINKPLTAIANNYLANQADYAADKVFPVIPVDDISGAYYSFTRGDWFRVEVEERGPASESAGADFRITHSDIYKCRRYALHSDYDIVTDAVAARNNFNLERSKTLFVTQNILLHREQKFANTFFTTGVWGTDLTGVNASPSTGQFLQWNDANSTPITDIRNRMTVMQATQGMRPNVLVLGQYVLDQLLEHPTIIERMKYTQAGVVSMQLLAQLLGVDRVVVANPIINSAAEGAADSFGFIYGKSALLAYANPNPDPQMPSAGYIFAWNGGPLGSQSYTAYTRRFDLPKETAVRIEVEMFYDMKVITPSLGTFFASAVA